MIGLTRSDTCELPFPLDRFGRHHTSQYDEDGILAVLVKYLRPPHYFVEIGCHPTECNCLALGWRGLFIDALAWGEPFKQEWVTPSNVEEILNKYQVPQQFGILSIDVDGQDLWVWQAVERRPYILVIEYNPQLGPETSISVKRDDVFAWDQTVYQGASLKALVKISNQKNYTLVHANGQNAFFVRDDLFINQEQFKYKLLWRPSLANHPRDKFNRSWTEI